MIRLISILLIIILVGIAPAPYKGVQALVPACLLHHAAE